MNRGEFGDKLLTKESVADQTIRFEVDSRDLRNLYIFCKYVLCC
jgi:hypothetical protein